MTMPNQPAPSGSQQVGSQWGQQDRGLTVEQAKARVRGEVGSSFGGLGTLFQNVLGGLLQGVANVINDFINLLFGGDRVDPVEVIDGQLQLNHRTDLLNKVSGFAVAYIPENYMQGATTVTGVTLLQRFNARIGPQKNATVNGDGTITLSKGTWQINCLFTSDTNSNSPTGLLRVVVKYPVGDPRITTANKGIYSIKETQDAIGGGRWTSFQCFHTVVCDAPGFRVQAEWGWWPGQLYKTLVRGGTHLSHLAVNRLDLSVDNEVVAENVPTGPDIS